MSSDLIERLRSTYTAWNNPPSDGLPEGASIVCEAAAHIESLEARIKAMSAALEPCAWRWKFPNETDWQVSRDNPTQRLKSGPIGRLATVQPLYETAPFDGAEPTAWLTRGIKPDCDPLPETFEEGHVGKVAFSQQGGPVNRLWWSEAFPVFGGLPLSPGPVAWMRGYPEMTCLTTTKPEPPEPGWKDMWVPLYAAREATR